MRFSARSRTRWLPHLKWAICAAPESRCTAYYEAERFYGESESPGVYAARVAKYYKLDPANSRADIDGQSIESFAMADNLMMMGALDDAGADIQPTFHAVVMRIAEYRETLCKTEASCLEP